MPVDLGARQARPSAPRSAARDRLEAGAHDLGGIGADIDGQRGRRDGEGREFQPEAGEAEIDEEDLDQQRRVADRLDIEPCRCREISALLRAAADGAKRADSAPSTVAKNGELQREQRAGQKARPSLEDRGKVEFEAHRADPGSGRSLVRHAVVDAEKRLIAVACLRHGRARRHTGW